MKKKFFKRVAAFVVASLMAVGVITVLPDECLSQIGTNVSAEGTQRKNIKIKRVEIVNNDITVTVDSLIDKNNNFINDGYFEMWCNVNDYNNILPTESLGLVYTYGCNYVDDNENIGEWGFSGFSNFAPFSGGGITLYLANHSYDEYYFDLGYADRNADNYESTFVNCIKVYFDPKHTYIEDFVSDETGHWYACSGCDEKIDFAAHTEDDGTVTIEPTGTTEGQKEYKCTLCGYTTRTEVVPKLEQASGIEINSVNFPDDVFRQYVSDNFDSNNDGLLSNEEISRITEVYLRNSGVQSFKGIEYFTVLKVLYCDSNQLTSLDVSKNTALIELCCNSNQLTSLDVNNNIVLEYLGCWDNQLTSLNVNNNLALTSLLCGRNQLTSLDVSKNTMLAYLDCDDNQLTSLNVQNNTALTTLFCANNQLTSLDINNNLLLTSSSFACWGNSYNIGEICGAYDLKNLQAGFDVTKTSNWQGATLTEDKLTEIVGTITYDYDCGNNHTATFNLTYTPVEHSYDDGVITTEPTEEAEGEKTYTCTVCGTTKTEVIEKLAHVHNQGTELKSDATGHWYTCSGCDEKLDFSIHTEDSGTVTVEPTETTEGEKVYKCTVCGHTTRTDVIAKLEHVHNKGNELVSDETGHWYTCSGCDEKLDFSTHMEDSGTITVEPTVTTEGQKVYKCTVCGYTTRIETIAKLGGGSNNPTGPSRPSQPAEPSKPTQPSNPSQPQQPETNGSETNISVKKGWGNVVKEINKANDNSKINVDMGNSTNVPKNVMNAIKGKNVDIVLDMGDGITWAINGKDVTNPQSIDFSVTKKKNQIPDDMISDPSNTIPLVLAHNGNFGCSATLSIDLKDNDNKIANLYYYNTKTKELEFVDSSVIVNGKASLVFTHASDWAIVISDTSAEYEDVSSAAGAYETDDNSQAPLCIIIIILAALGFPIS